MSIYQRMTMVNAVQFNESDYAKDTFSYPDVWDKGVFSKQWRDKTANDGRYYIINQPNTNIGENESITVNNGDYIIREEMGIVYTLPKEIFERNYEKLID